MNIFKTKLEKILFVLVIISAFLWGADSFVISPLSKELALLKNSIKEKHFQVLKLKVLNKKNTAQNLSEMSLNLKKADINEESDYSEFILTLEEIAGKIRLPIANIKKMPSAVNKNLKLLSFRIEIEGPIDKLIEYINEISLKDYNIGIISAGFQKNQEKGRNIKLFLEVTKSLLI